MRHQGPARAPFAPEHSSEAAMAIEQLVNPQPETGYGELVRALNESGSFELVSEIANDCQNILEQDSYRTVLRSARYRVSTEFAPFNPKDYDPSAPGMIFYARAAQEISRKNKPTDTPKIIFDRTPDPKVHTDLATALSFREGVRDGEMHLELAFPLKNGDGVDVSIDDPRYIKLANDLIDVITDKVNPKLHVSMKTPTEKLKKAADRLNPAQYANNIINYLTENERSSSQTWNPDSSRYLKKGERRRRAIYVGSAALFTMYGHVIGAGFDSADITVAGVPLPVAPIEIINDLTNSSDHTAQGFEAPEGATEVSVDNVVNLIPVLAGYETSGVPDATFDPGGTSSNPYELSKPGLYEIDFSLNNSDLSEAVAESNAELDDDEELEESRKNYIDRVFRSSDNCFKVVGNYIDGETVVFTQTPSLEEALQIEVIDQDTAEVCSTDTDAQVDGSVFFYQN